MPQRLGAPVTGAALAKDEARITIRGVPDRPGVVHAIFRTIAAAKIVVDMIVQNVSRGGKTEVSFTVAKGDLPETLRAAEAASREIGATSVTHDAEVAKVSVVGLGMRTHTGVATTLVRGSGGGRHQHPDDHNERDQDQRPGRSVRRPRPRLRVAHQAFALEQLNGTPSTFTPQVADAGQAARHEAGSAGRRGPEPQER